MSHEMAFGSWENVKVKDMETDHMCHLFYLAQNAVVKATKPHVTRPGIPSENFIEVHCSF